MFDAIAVFGNNVANSTLYHRLQHLKGIKRAFLATAGRQKVSASHVPLVLETKQFVAAHKISEVASLIHYDKEIEEWIYDNPAKRVRVKNDGLVLTPDRNNYMMKQSKGNTHVIYKLKWIGLQTVDFLLTKSSFFNGDRPSTPATVELYTTSSPLHRGAGMDVLFTRTKISATDLEKVQSWFLAVGSDSIVAECVYNPDVGYWNFKHHRKDKDKPNYITTAISSMEAMAENLTWKQVEEVLMIGHRARGVLADEMGEADDTSTSGGLGQGQGQFQRRGGNQGYGQRY